MIVREEQRGRDGRQVIVDREGQGGKIMIVKGQRTKKRGSEER